ncbi:hypothetical protein B0T19DRAFT_423070 [Cercophora scortea]|uniref:FAD-binding FR-type domain-containing protein n=1 Tax=Cercophora scortea TaxID=314031 RepID=A0AAE0MEA1_9PEZI|nr:hypothetical protein B0T19DRAFT_423070 [Cercophora scortea]
MTCLCHISRIRAPASTLRPSNRRLQHVSRAASTFTSTSHSSSSPAFTHLKSPNSPHSSKWPRRTHRSSAFTSTRQLSTTPSKSTNSNTSSSTSNNKSNKDDPKKSHRKHWTRRWPAKTSLLLLLTICALPTVSEALRTGDSNCTINPLQNYLVGRPLNPTTFVPFTITAREQVSPTSFILTVRPLHARDAPFFFLPDLHANKPILTRAWEHGLWSVEIKQPQLQVARDYTPLPPLHNEAQNDLETGVLRFLVRKLDGGEVSTYLSRLSVGDKIELRGPHLGFDLRARVGESEKDVVFLAGGTGIAPALQAARVLLGDGNDGTGKRSRVSILWANRHRADCEGPGGIISLLAEERQRHGDRLRYACTVDEEGTFINTGAIVKQTGMSSSLPSSSPGRWSWVPFSGNKTPPPPSTASDLLPATAAGEDTCAYHSAKRLITMPARDTPGEKGCTCAEQQQQHWGKNLLMVSGPDGFIATFAGAKVWGAGEELQGPVGGVVGTLRKQNPRFWADWLVLKL